MLRLLPTIGFLVLVGCAKTSDGETTAKKGPPTTDGWAVYEDDMFKAEYPTGSEVFGANSGKQDPKFPNLGIVPPPHAHKAATGGFFLQPDKVTANMLLRDAIQNEISRIKGKGGVLITQPRDISVSNGRCINALVVAPTDNCPKNSGSCFSPLVLTQCDSSMGARFTAGTVLSVGPARDGLSPQARQEVAVYERILRSLEFKKS
jgi:hypothetical protein